MFSWSLSYEESCGSFVHNSIICCIYSQLSNIVSSDSYLASASIESCYEMPLACIGEGKIQQVLCGAAEHLLQKTNLATFRSVQILLLMSQVLIMTTLKLFLCRQSNQGGSSICNSLLSIQSRVACNPCCTGWDPGQCTEFLTQHRQVREKGGCYHHELSLEVVQGCLSLGIIAKSLFGSS